MELNPELLVELKSAVGTIATISEIPDKSRTIIQREKLKAARELLSENYEYLFDTLSHDWYVSMKNTLDDESYQLSEFESILGADETQSPRITSAMEVSHIEEAIIQIYGAQTTISGILEVLLPKYDKWTNHRKRAEMVMKALIQSSSEWKSEAVYSVYEPIEVTTLFANFTECVSAYKQRMKTLENSYATLSRLLSLKMGTPAEPLFRKNTTNSRFS
jgi:hypothetical protein